MPVNCQQKHKKFLTDLGTAPGFLIPRLQYSFQSQYFIIHWFNFLNWISGITQLFKIQQDLFGTSSPWNIQDSFLGFFAFNTMLSNSFDTVFLCVI